MAEAKTPVHVDNKMVKAILVTLLCCLPFGIVSIIKASEVNNKVAMGDIEGAQLSAKDADKWANIGMIIAGVGWGLYLIFIVFAVLLSM